MEILVRGQFSTRINDLKDNAVEFPSMQKVIYDFMDENYVEHVYSFELVSNGSQSLSSMSVKLYEHCYDFLQKVSDVILNVKVHSAYSKEEILQSVEFWKKMLNDEQKLIYTLTCDDTRIPDSIAVAVFLPIYTAKDSEESMLSFEAKKTVSEKFYSFATVNDKTPGEFLEELLSQYSKETPVDIVACYAEKMK